MKDYIFFILCAIFMFVVFALIVPSTAEFKEACRASGGATVFNGRNWECVK